MSTSTSSAHVKDSADRGKSSNKNLYKRHKASRSSHVLEILASDLSAVNIVDRGRNSGYNVFHTNASPVEPASKKAVQVLHKFAELPVGIRLKIWKLHYESETRIIQIQGMGPGSYDSVVFDNCPFARFLEYGRAGSQMIAEGKKNGCMGTFCPFEREVARELEIGLFGLRDGAWKTAQFIEKLRTGVLYR